MAEKEDSIRHICALVARQVQDVYRNLTPYFIVHDNGHLSEAIALHEGSITRLRNGHIARVILNKKKEDLSQSSSFLGLAVSREKALLGLTHRDIILALFNINLDAYREVKDARRHVYHLVWHALDVADILQRPDYSGKAREGPIVPKRSPMNLAKANLQADAFAAAVTKLQGEKDAIEMLARQRSEEALTISSTHRAEDYPFIIGMEATQFAYNELNKTPVQKSRIVPLARQLSLEVGQMFDDSAIRQWWAFAEPAQDMAWRGHKKDEILGAAVNTSEDPYVRATGYLISEVTGLEGRTALELMNVYNAFTDQERNNRLHRELVNSTFEEAMTISIEESSSHPFLEAANHQNQELTDGRIIGWCAGALQSAARAFESALANGKSPGQAARLEFEGNRQLTTWEAIKRLGEDIISQRRLGFAVTLANVAELCNLHKDLAPVAESIEKTLNDPAFMQKLAPANDLQISPLPMPSGPKMAIAPRMDAVPASAPSGPGLGGGSSNMIRQRLMQEREKRRGENQTDKT